MIKKETDNFDSLVKEIGRTGGYGAPSGISYAMAIVINRMGGWVEVCSWRYRDLPRKRQIFNVIHREVLKMLDNPSATSLHPIPIGGLHKTVLISPGKTQGDPKAPFDSSRYSVDGRFAD